MTDGRAFNRVRPVTLGKKIEHDFIEKINIICRE